METHRIRHRTLLVVVVVAVAMIAAVPAVSAQESPVSFGYNESPHAVDTAPIGTDYTHNFSIETNATDGPLLMTVYHNRSADLDYSSHSVDLAGSEIDTRLNISNVTVDNRELTRIRVTNRSVPGTGDRTFDVEMALAVSETPTNETVYTGGTHGPSGKTLPLNETTVTAAGTDIAPTDIALSDSSPTEGDTVGINVTVENMGRLDAGIVPIAVEVDGSEIATQNITLSALSQNVTTVDWSVSNSGSNEIRVAANSSDIDLNSTNDTRTRTVSVSSSGGGGGGGGSLPPSDDDGEDDDTNSDDTDESNESQSPSDDEPDNSPENEDTGSDSTGSNTNDTDNGDTSDVEIPGFGIPVALVAIVGAIVIAVRRQQ